MNPDELQERATQFGVRVLKFVDQLPRTRSADVIAYQLAKSGTSVGANYRAARRARSKKEFYAKLCIVVEEADEAEHWLDIIARTEMISPKRVEDLHREATELLKIFSAMRKSSGR